MKLITVQCSSFDPNVDNVEILILWQFREGGKQLRVTSIAGLSVGKVKVGANSRPWHVLICCFCYGIGTRAKHEQNEL
jgi:hypothetical protein